MDLPSFHEALLEHFSKLAAERAVIDSPVFALEHNLDSEQVVNLKNAIQSRLKFGSPDSRFWLPWAVYATEIGYEFEGHEYWDSFQEETPNWNGQYRGFIRDSFKTFVTTFRGFTPSGIWANHFNIICYPITHSILPRDLQSQLARILRDLRYQFRPSLLHSSQQLGNKILSRSEGTTKRFQQFAQNIELTGLIARELLTHGQNERDGTILPSALERIAADLRLHRDAGSWLDEARTFAKEKVSRGARVKNESDASHRIRLAPTLILRRTTVNDWDLFIEIPDLQPLAEQSSELSEFLTSSRPRINGSFYERRLARGSLVSYGTIREKLKALPDENQPLLMFRRERPAALNEFLRDEFCLKTQQINLFKIHVDGLAYLQKSTCLRRASRYVFLSRIAVPRNNLIFRQSVSCEGLFLYSFSLPETVSTIDEAFLFDLGFELTRGVDITPVGSPPALWDQESYIEYLADEEPCIAIELDHEPQFLQFEYGGNKVEITNPVEVPLLVNLPQLSLGSYKFVVSEKSSEEDDYEVLSKTGIAIREPRTQQSATTRQNVLLLFTDPYRPTFEQLFANKVKFDFWTPPDTIVDTFVTLVKGDDIGDELLRKRLFTCSLPEDASTLDSKVFDGLEDNQIRGKLDDAVLCTLEFQAGDLGSVAVKFEREFLSVKWSVRAGSDNRFFLRLSDSSDSEERISISKYDFSRPSRRTTVVCDNMHDTGIPVPDSGGLYVAENSKIRQGIVIMRRLERTTFTSFTDLEQPDGFTPTIDSYPRTREGLLKLVNLYTLWVTSTSAGSSLRKVDTRTVASALMLEIVSLIDDNRGWKRGETLYCADQRANPNNLLRLISTKHSISQKVARLCDGVRTTEELIDGLVVALGDDIPTETVSLAGSLAVRKKIPQKWFAEFALRLCSRPDTLAEWVGKRIDLGLEKALLHPVLVRAARYTVLTANRKSIRSPNNLPYNWDWE